MIGQMMEPASFDHLPAPSPPARPWCLTGEPGAPRRCVRSFRLSPEELGALNDRLQARYEEIERREVRYELTGPADAQVVLVAYGTCARVCRQVVERPPRALPFTTALLRPITLWPFPSAALREVAQQAGRMLVVEMSAGQMVEDVRLAVEGRCPVAFLGRMGGFVPSANEISEKAIGLFA
jgi:2-oxoglutarate ferredoxin oxidoreductase subunit alpha